MSGSLVVHVKAPATGHDQAPHDLAGQGGIGLRCSFCDGLGGPAG
jgi:hypothetical protein